MLKSHCSLVYADDMVCDWVSSALSVVILQAVS